MVLVLVFGCACGCERDHGSAAGAWGAYRCCLATQWLSSTRVTTAVIPRAWAHAACMMGLHVHHAAHSAAHDAWWSHCGWQRADVMDMSRQMCHMRVQ